MKVKNLNSKIIEIVKGQEHSHLKSFLPLRDCSAIVETALLVGEVDDIPFYQVDHGVSSLPEPEKGTIFIVTSVVEALSDREDLYAPLMPVYEDERVIKCLGLVQSKNTSNPKKE